jgi:hypothetical protein
MTVTLIKNYVSQAQQHTIKDVMTFQHEFLCKISEHTIPLWLHITWIIVCEQMTAQRHIVIETTTNVRDYSHNTNYTNCT